MTGKQPQQVDTRPNAGAAGDQDAMPPAAQRALAEAKARRHAIDEKAKGAAEAGGPKGKEPTRYGDWEMKGRAIDF